MKFITSNTPRKPAEGIVIDRAFPIEADLSAFCLWKQTKNIELAITLLRIIRSIITFT